MNLGKFMAISALCALPVVMHANSGANPASPNPPLKRTGAAVDGGLTCAACHTTYAPANSDPRGRIVVQAKPYAPGVKQTIHVRVDHPEGKRWGFQLTARLASDETKVAGTFSPSASVRVECDDGVPSADGNVRGAAGPCSGGQLEFASHNGTSTQQNAAAGTWDVEWTPPAADVGEVVFYAAGNAADNSGNNRGDRIYTTSHRISNCSLSGKPSISAISNGASFVPGCSQNAMITIFGGNLMAAGQKKEAGANDFDDLDFPRELGCLAVEIGGVRAPITFVNDQQINAQVPVGTVGPSEVRVIANPGRANENRGDPSTVTITKYSPAFFTFGASKNIAAVTVVDGAAVYIAGPAAAAGGRPAKPGETLSLYGTGFGPASGGYGAGVVTPDPSKLLDPVTIMIGGTILATSDVSYAGLAPGAITGLYQFNVRVPDAAPDGDVPVTIDIGGMQTQSGAFIPVKK